MCLTNGSLVLEGGGMRGAFTAGVLDVFLDNDIMFNRIYGVSMGACHACSYISRQRGRAFRVVADYINDPRYMKYSNVLKGGDLFSPEFVYHTIPDKLYPFDYETFRNYKGEFYAVMTNCTSGKPTYMRVRDLAAEVDIVRASASLPGFSRIVRLDGGDYLDGGMTDSIPVKKAAADGAEKIIAVLTRETGYVKEPSKAYRITRILHPLHPKLSKSIKNRHIMYNETLEYISDMEAAGKIFVIRPPEGSLNIARLERDRAKLEALYERGCETAQEQLGALKAYLNTPERTETE